jgi:hypothetical protein
LLCESVRVVFSTIIRDLCVIIYIMGSFVMYLYCFQALRGVSVQKKKKHRNRGGRRTLTGKPFYKQKSLKNRAIRCVFYLELRSSILDPMCDASACIIVLLYSHESLSVCHLTSHYWREMTTISGQAYTLVLLLPGQYARSQEQSCVR